MSRDRGFTLIELIVSITLISMTLMGLLSVNAFLTRLLRSGDRASTAAFYTQQRLEALRATDCDDLTNGWELQEGTYQLVWTVERALNDRARRIQLRTFYATPPNPLHADTVETSVLCVR